jgi:hypothetical protein
MRGARPIDFDLQLRNLAKRSMNARDTSNARDDVQDSGLSRSSAGSSPKTSDHDLSVDLRCSSTLSRIGCDIAGSRPA